MIANFKYQNKNMIFYIYMYYVCNVFFFLFVLFVLFSGYLAIFSYS